MLGTIRKVLKIANPIAINAFNTTGRFNISMDEKAFWLRPKWAVIPGSLVYTATQTHNPKPPTT